MSDQFATINYLIEHNELTDIILEICNILLNYNEYKFQLCVGKQEKIKTFLDFCNSQEKKNHSINNNINNITLLIANVCIKLKTYQQDTNYVKTNHQLLKEIVHENIILFQELFVNYIE